jgi:hypothetical protein
MCEETKPIMVTVTSRFGLSDGIYQKPKPGKHDAQNLLIP